MVSVRKDESSLPDDPRYRMSSHKLFVRFETREAANRFASLPYVLFRGTKITRQLLWIFKMTQDGTYSSALRKNKGNNIVLSDLRCMSTDKEGRRAHREQLTQLVISVFGLAGENDIGHLAVQPDGTAHVNIPHLSMDPDGLASRWNEEGVVVNGKRVRAMSSVRWKKLHPESGSSEGSKKKQSA